MNDQKPRRVGLKVYAVILMVFLGAPILVTIPLAFTGRQSFAFPPESWSTQWFVKFFADPAWFDSLVNSLVLATAVTVVSTVLGTLAALGINRSRSRFIPALRGFLLAPRIVPVVVMAIAIFSVFLRWQLSGTLRGFILAHTVLAVPIVMLPVAARLEDFDRRLEMAAASLGAGPWQTFRLITFPLIAPGMFTGMLFAFATSFDETVIALFLSSPQFKTLPVRMYESITIEVDPTIAAASTIVLALTGALFGVVSIAKRTLGGAR